MKKKWLFTIIGVVVVAGAVMAARSKSKPDAKAEELPFRLGKVQTEDLQVSVREVGVVDPENKVDVKSTVSGRIVALKVREGDLLKKGAVLAEVEPDVTQAQSLSDVNSAVTKPTCVCRNAQRELRAQQALYDAGLIGAETLKNFVSARDLASQSKRRRQGALLDRRAARHSDLGSSASQIARVTAPMDGVVITKGVELGETVTSGVSSFNAGTVLFTVADLESLIIRVNLNEVDIAKVHVGQPVRITLDAYPQKTFTGKVRFVAPAAKLQEKIKVFRWKWRSTSSTTPSRPA
jgi:RND family efflux transporter MFP subunit